MTPDVTLPDTAETLWVIADRIRFLGPIAGSALDLIECLVPPGSGTPPHHHASPETFHVLDGRLTVRTFSPGAPPAAIQADAGTTIRIPSGQPHNYANEGDAPVRMLVMVDPSMTAFFRDLGTSEPTDRPDFARIGAAMERHGIATLAAAA